MDQCLGSLFSTLLSPLASLMNHITEHATYLFNVGDNVRDLENATLESTTLESTTSRNLERRMKDNNIKIDIAKRRGLTTTHEVEGWLKQVEAIISETHDIKEKYSNRSCKCAGRYSLNCCSNYSIGKRAARKLLAAQNLYNEGAFESVAVEVPPPIIPVKPTASSESSQVDPNLQTALRYLHDDTVTNIGIWGMGGVGKTHLLNKIKNSFYLGNSIFDVVTLVTASKECSIEKVQQEIFTNLGLGEYRNDVQAGANTINNFLTNRSFLLLVDDLWEPLDLKKVGVPSDSYKQKMVLTTRSDQVCGGMKVNQEIKVNQLDDDSAWTLFQENVGEETLRSYPSTFAKEIVKELGGLPLALITIGRAMHAKKHVREWEHVLELLKESRLHEIERGTKQEDSTTFQILKISYESLESDTLRQCFLRCSMWPEDYEIPKEDLIQCWIGLGLVKGFTMRNAYNAGYDLIGKLQAACLLQDSTSCLYGTVEKVKMHDVLRDMALWVARDRGDNNDKWIVKAGIGQVKALSEEMLCKAEGISLMMNRLERLPFPSSLPSSNKLTTLFLQGNRLDRTALENIQFFYALTYLDLCYNSFIEFPVEICKLVKLQYLNLSGNSLGSLPEELKSLTNLKYLHLRDNRIHTIPEGVFSELNALQMLDLSHNSRVNKVTSLLEELNRLNNLRALGITVEGEFQFHLLQRSTDLPFQSIEVHSLKEPTLSLTTNFSFINDLEIRKSITKEILIESSGQNANSHLDLERLSFSHMEYLDTIVWNGVSPRDLFPRLCRLQITSCHELKNVSWIVHLPCLWELGISGCFGMEYLISSTEDNHGENFVAEIQGEGRDILIPTFPCLKIMVLRWLTELHAICDPGVTFPSLRYLMSLGCPKLKKLPFQPHNIPSKLEKIECRRSEWEAFEWDDDSLRDSLQKICTLRHW